MCWNNYVELKSERGHFNKKINTSSSATIIGFALETMMAVVEIQRTEFLGPSL